jgi:hypothetical protein
MLARRSVASDTSNPSNGVVAIVVTIAMIMVNRVGVITPRSAPKMAILHLSRSGQG